MICANSTRADRAHLRPTRSPARAAPLLFFTATGPLRTGRWSCGLRFEKTSDHVLEGDEEHTTVTRPPLPSCATCRISPRPQRYDSSSSAEMSRLSADRRKLRTEQAWFCVLYASDMSSCGAVVGGRPASDDVRMANATCTTVGLAGGARLKWRCLSLVGSNTTCGGGHVRTGMSDWPMIDVTSC